MAALGQRLAPSAGFPTRKALCLLAEARGLEVVAAKRSLGTLVVALRKATEVVID